MLIEFQLQRLQRQTNCDTEESEGNQTALGRFWRIDQSVLETGEKAISKADEFPKTMKTATRELEYVRNRSQTMVGKDRTPDVIDLDEAINALEEIKSDLAKTKKKVRINKVDIAKPSENIAPPSFKEKPTEVEKFSLQEEDFDNLEEIKNIPTASMEGRAHQTKQ